MNWLFFWRSEEEPPDDETDTTSKLIEQIYRAKMEWHHSQHLFNWAVHPEGVDYAVYTMEAAERKYMFLLNEAKRLGITAYHQHP